MAAKVALAVTLISNPGGSYACCRCAGCVFSWNGFFGAQTKNPVSEVTRDVVAARQKTIVAAVEAMPADKFGYKPTADQMTFGHLAQHIVEANNFFCAKAADIAEPKVEVKETDGKDKLVAAVKASFDFCTTSLAKTDDSKLGDTIEGLAVRNSCVLGRSSPSRPILRITMGRRRCI